MESNVFHREPQSALPIAVGGEGPYIYDKNGNQYFDASGGAAVSCLGHNNPQVIAAIKEQIDAIAYAHTGFFTTEALEELATLITGQAPLEMNYAWFTSGGSEAVEAALKMTRQFFLERGEEGRKHIITRWRSYHGNTLGALAVGGNSWRRKPFEAMLMPVHLIAPCYEYRFKDRQETSEEYTHRVADELELTIQSLGADKVSCFIAETVVGATAGAVAPTKGYFKRIREICDRYGVVLILDEVMCGMGRTGTYYSFEQDGVVPDIITVAKTLGGGYQPIGAVIVHDNIYNTFYNGSGFFQHGHTYTGHPTASAGALALQKQILAKGMMENINDKSQKLFKELRNAFNDNPHVGDIRGRGLLIGLELVANKETKEPFAPEYKLHKRIKQNGMKNGLICYPGWGTADGEIGTHILIAPPYMINDQHIDEIVTKLKTTVDESLENLAP